MNVVVCGGRDFTSYELMCERLDHLLQSLGKVKIIHGGNGRKDKNGKAYIGADLLAERYAKERGLEHEAYPADWDKHGKAAGPMRNEEMAKIGNLCIAFWDGNSRGTANMLSQARRYKLPIKIVYYSIPKLILRVRDENDIF